MSFNVSIYSTLLVLKIVAKINFRGSSQITVLIFSGFVLGSTFYPGMGFKFSVIYTKERMSVIVCEWEGKIEKEKE